MKNEFRGQFRPTEAEFAELWRVGLFVLDANVLMNLYRYSMDTRAELMRVLRALGDRLWIPRQAAREYFDNRLTVIGDQKNAYSQLLSFLEKSSNQVEERMNTLHRGSGQEAEVLVRRVEDAHCELKNHVRMLREGAIEETNSAEEDEVLACVAEFNVGESYPSEREQEIFGEGKTRYQSKTPPGYEDESKPGDEKFGDLLLWFQILDKAKEVEKPVVLITDDRKEDWWWKAPKDSKRTIGPRPELIAEMHEKASVSFYAYLPERFLELSKTHLHEEVSAEAIAEVGALPSLDDLGSDLVDRQERLKEVWDRLSDEEKVVANLYFNANSSIGEIGESRGKSPEEVSAILSSAASKMDNTLPEGLGAGEESTPEQPTQEPTPPNEASGSQGINFGGPRGQWMLPQPLPEEVRQVIAQAAEAAKYLPSPVEERVARELAKYRPSPEQLRAMREAAEVARQMQGWRP